MKLAFVQDGARFSSAEPRNGGYWGGDVAGPRKRALAFVAKTKFDSRPISEGARIGGDFGAHDFKLKMLKAPREQVEAQEALISERTVKEHEVRSRVHTEI